VRSVRKGERDYGGKDLWKGKVLSLEWNRDGVMHSETGDNDGDDDEPVRER